MATDGDDATAGLATDAPGLEEGSTFAWPMLLRRRVIDRMEASEHYPWLVLAVVLFGLFAVGSTITILAIAVPTIAEDLGTDVNTVSWVTTGPILAFAVFGPLGGKLADLRGLRKAYLFSLAGAMVFAGLTALSPTATALIAFRVCGAAIGAATGPASLAIINRTFPPSRRSQALGYWAMVAAGGPVIGALIGAPIIEAYGWRWIFIAQVPVMALCLAVAFAVLPHLPTATELGGKRSRLDGWGAATLGLGCVSLLLAVNRGAVNGWDSPAVIIGALVAIAMFGAFVAVERRVEHPLLPLAYTRQPNFSFPIAAQFCMNFAYMGAFAITPLLLQEEFNRTAVEATWLSIPRPLVFAIAGPVAGYLTIRVGERRAAVFGATSITLSMLALSQVDAASRDAFIVFAVALSGLGMGSASPAMSTAIASAVDEHDLGIAGAFQQMVNQVGVAIGIQVMLAVQTSRDASVGGVAAYSEAYLVAAGVAAIGILLATRVRSTLHGVAVGRDEGAAHGDAPEAEGSAAADLVPLATR
jgi:EmrB/QacA subfamily drug resistance transporter